MKLKYSALLALGLVATQAMAQQPTSEPSAPVMTQAPAAPAAPDMDKVNTALGMYFGNVIKNNFVGADPDAVVKSMKAFLDGSAPAMTEKEIGATLNAAAMASRAKLAEQNKKAGEDFLAKNSKEPGVTTTASGLEYLVLTEGTGPVPQPTDTVVVHYKGTLLDGTEFDSSYTRNTPFTTQVSGGVIPGWQEALKLMKVGSKWKIFIPSALAYGERGSSPRIQPNSALIFEIELLSIKEPTPDANQSVSGEIIKVPSAEEMKKGAKIETIRPGQTNAVETK